jgi:hypothetical protein
MWCAGHEARLAVSGARLGFNDVLPAEVKAKAEKVIFSTRRSLLRARLSKTEIMLAKVFIRAGEEDVTEEALKKGYQRIITGHVNDSKAWGEEDDPASTCWPALYKRLNLGSKVAA